MCRWQWVASIAVDILGHGQLPVGSRLGATQAHPVSCTWYVRPLLSCENSPPSAPTQASPLHNGAVLLIQRPPPPPPYKSYNTSSPPPSPLHNGAVLLIQLVLGRLIQAVQVPRQRAVGRYIGGGNRSPPLELLLDCHAGIEAEVLKGVGRFSLGFCQNTGFRYDQPGVRGSKYG